MKLMQYQRLVSHGERVTGRREGNEGRREAGRRGLAVVTAGATAILTASAAIK